MSIDSMRLALINYIVSRQKNEQFIVRIEDIDKEHLIEGMDQEILDLLKKFSIEQDQLFYQSDTLGRHQQFALSLMAQKKAFACICATESCTGTCLHDQERIAAHTKTENLPYVIRIKQPKESIRFVDALRGEIITDPHEIGCFVILQADGAPTHAFATACDDMLANISLIVRSQTDIHHAPLQIHIQHALGYTAPMAFAHLPTLCHASEEETGNHNGENTIKWLLTEGFLLDTIINYLLLMGNKTPTEIFTLPEAIEWFTLENLSQIPATFDIQKLRFLNRAHLGAMEDIALSRIFGFADADIGKLLKLYLDEASTINELERTIKAIFAPKECSPEMQTIATLIQDAPMFETFDDLQQYSVDQSGIEKEKLSTSLRLLMTGAQNGPKLSDIYPLIKPYITEIARCISC
jgi:glutamyl-tRNA synthetase